MSRPFEDLNQLAEYVFELPPGAVVDLHDDSPLSAEAPGRGDDGAGPEAMRNVPSQQDDCHHQSHAERTPLSGLAQWPRRD